MAGKVFFNKVYSDGVNATGITVRFCAQLFPMVCVLVRNNHSQIVPIENYYYSIQIPKTINLGIQL